MITSLKIASVNDLKREICRVAMSCIALARSCNTFGRVMTMDEALKWAATSVSLLKAVMTKVGKGGTPMKMRMFLICLVSTVFVALLLTPCSDRVNSFV
jgi:hypothetical protein